MFLGVNGLHAAVSAAMASMGRDNRRSDFIGQAPTLNEMYT
ncbi:hypothetical protein HMPREF1522_1711 [Actinomyces sp. ICM54]|nr:hypothetical protein HMPREF1522_1711 [Actinomyces sp. ICM54]